MYYYMFFQVPALLEKMITQYHKFVRRLTRIRCGALHSFFFSKSLATSTLFTLQILFDYFFMSQSNLERYQHLTFVFFSNYATRKIKMFEERQQKETTNLSDFDCAKILIATSTKHVYVKLFQNLYVFRGIKKMEL